MDGDPVSYQAWTETYAADHAAREAAYRDWYEQWSQANP